MKKILLFALTAAAALTLGEAHEETGNFYHTGILVHNYHTAGTNDSVEFLNGIEVKWFI